MLPLVVCEGQNVSERYLTSPVSLFPEKLACIALTTSISFLLVTGHLEDGEQWLDFAKTCCSN